MNLKKSIKKSRYFWLTLGCLFILVSCNYSKNDYSVIFHINHGKSFYTKMGLDKCVSMKIDGSDTSWDIILLIKNDTVITTDYKNDKIKALRLNNTYEVLSPHQEDVMSYYDFKNNNIYWVEAGKDNVFCKNILTGSVPITVAYTNIGVLDKVVVDSERIYVAGMKGVTIFSKMNGERIVEFNHSPLVNSDVNFAISDSIIYLSGIHDTSFSYVYVISYNLNTNTVLWKTRIPDQNENKVVLHKNNILIQSRSEFGPSQNIGTLFCIDKRTGIKKWEDNKVNTITTPIIYKDDVFCEDINQDKLKCINMNNDEVRWVKGYRFFNPLYTPFIFHDNLYLPEEGWIYHINIANGNVIDSIETDTRDIQCLYDNKMHPYLLVGREIFW